MYMVAAIENLSHHLMRLLGSAQLNPGQISQAWPVGSVFVSTVATDPATLMGFGTWAAFGTGRVLVGRDTGQTEFDTLEKTGGAKAHTLSLDEIPAHAHTHDSPNSPGLNRLLGALPSVAAVSSGTATSTVGGGQAHNNLQPFIVVNFWRRTA